MSGVLRKLGPEAIGVAATVLKYRADPIASMRRYWNLYRHRFFSPDEIRFFQLLDPSLTSEDLLRVVSKEELLRIQDQLNPHTARILAEDKLRFHDHCIENGLPVPAILGLYSTREPTRLEELLRSISLDALIFKPVDGVNGEGVMRLQRHANDWTDDAGSVVDAEALEARISASPYQRWMFQELVHGHPELCELSSTHGLQTVRVVTALEADGDVKILATRLRLICGDTPYDNFNYGTTGNVIANVDVDSGSIISVVRNEHGTMRYIDHHPRTGVPLLGYQPPQWDAVKALAIRAARAFAPLTTVGWDVGISLPEPVLIEGNATWGILSGEPRLGDIYRYLTTLHR